MVELKKYTRGLNILCSFSDALKDKKQLYMHTDILPSRFLKNYKNFLKLRADFVKLYQILFICKGKPHAAMFFQLQVCKKLDIF